MRIISSVAYPQNNGCKINRSRKVLGSVCLFDPILFCTALLENTVCNSLTAKLTGKKNM